VARTHAYAVQNDRRGETRQLTVVSGDAELHFPIDHLRIGEHLVDSIDRACRYSVGFQRRK
jgi:hypothetical protein